MFAVLHPTSAGDTISSITVTGTSGSFDLTVNVPGTAADISVTGLSTNEAASSYLGDYLGLSATSPKGAYVYAIFPEAVTSVGTAVSMSAVTSSTALFFSGSTYGRFSQASTPYIQSQTVGGDNIDLFRLHTLGDGNSANKEIKVSFLNMKLGTNDDWATFSMLVRSYDDTDSRIEVLEQYDNLNFDPDSPTYVARVIGNSAPYDDPNTKRELKVKVRN